MMIAVKFSGLLPLRRTPGKSMHMRMAATSFRTLFSSSVARFNWPSTTSEAAFALSYTACAAASVLSNGAFSACLLRTSLSAASLSSLAFGMSAWASMEACLASAEAFFASAIAFSALSILPLASATFASASFTAFFAATESGSTRLFRSVASWTSFAAASASAPASCGNASIFGEASGVTETFPPSSGLWPALSCAFLASS
mmetsp:Transcript_4368/g.12150  ORF Transcript_4368/g.12150 Transcript_4368/m.12150 type:complete len:202 (-) Transcript_4368:2346-2951(-)